MSTLATEVERMTVAEPRKAGTLLPLVLGGIFFVVLFWAPFTTLLRDWWSDPEAGHGLLLGPVAAILAWKRGLIADPKGQPVLGTALLFFAVVLRYLSSLAAELFTMRASLLLAVCALIIYAYGLRQVLHWWLPLTLIALSIPLPSVVLGSIALPLQLNASQMGAALLEWRNVPVRLSGNIISLPGRSLFVTEACSGLRSLTALLSLGVLIAGLWLRLPVLRALIIALTIPIAVFLNGVRVFLTGFLVYFVDPKLGDGLMHYTEGWVMFVVAFAILGAIAWVLVQFDTWWKQRTV
jgi:exosortase